MAKLPLSLVCLILGLGQLGATPNTTQPNPQPCLDACAEIQGTKGMIPSKRVSHLVVTDSKDAQLAVIDKTEVPERLKSHIRWAYVSRTSTGDPGVLVNVRTFIDEKPGTVLDGYSTWQYTGETQFHGRQVSAWVGTKEEKKDETKATLFLSKETAKICGLRLALPMRAMGVQSYEVELDYPDNPPRFPSKITHRIVSRFLFKEKHLLMEQTPLEWVMLDTIPLSSK